MLKKTVPPVARNLLESLIGDDFKFIGGENLPQFLVSDSLVVQSSGIALNIFGDIEEQALGEDSHDDFSFFVVERASLPELESIKESGHMYLQDKGSPIKDVLIIRSQISSTSEGKHWELTWDSGIVLELASGYVAISFLSLSAEGLRVDFLEELSLEALPEPTSVYDDSLSGTFSILRTVLPVALA